MKQQPGFCERLVAKGRKKGWHIGPNQVTL